MLHPLQAGDVGGVEFLFVLLVYLGGSVLYLLLPPLVLSRLREERWEFDGLVGGRLGSLVRGRLGSLVRGRVGESVRARLDELHWLRRPSGVDSRNR